MSGDVCEELAKARRLIVAGDYWLALNAVHRAEKAWAIEVDAWAIELRDAEREINGR